jgi:hypothetical protein
LGSNNWTLEFCIYPNGAAQSYARVFQTTDGDVSGTGISLIINSGALTLYLSSVSTSYNILSGASIYTLTVGNLSKILIQRVSNIIQCFANGVLVYSVNISGSLYYNSTDSIIIGGNATGTCRSINAYLDEIRFTKGIALVSSYPLSTSEFPNS